MRRNLSVAVIVLLSLIVLAGCNSAEKQAASSAGPLASPPKTGTTPSDGVRRITVPELRDLVAKNQVFIVDVRDEATFKKGHIHGAKLMPVAEILNHTSELPKDKLIVTYCS